MRNGLSVGYDFKLCWGKGVFLNDQAYDFHLDDLYKLLKKELHLKSLFKRPEY